MYLNQSPTIKLQILRRFWFDPELGLLSEVLHEEFYLKKKKCM